MSRPSRPEPDARLIYARGDYRHALLCYHAAQELMLNWGLCFAPDVCGIINSPRHPRYTEPKGSVPDELIDDPIWEASIDLWFDDARRLEWLRNQQLPAGLRLELKEGVA